MGVDTRKSVRLCDAWQLPFRFFGQATDSQSMAIKACRQRDDPPSKLAHCTSTTATCEVYRLASSPATELWQTRLEGPCLNGSSSEPRRLLGPRALRMRGPNGRKRSTSGSATCSAVRAATSGLRERRHR